MQVPLFTQQRPFFYLNTHDPATVRAVTDHQPGLFLRQKRHFTIFATNLRRTSLTADSSQDPHFIIFTSVLTALLRMRYEGLEATKLLENKMLDYPFAQACYEEAHNIVNNEKPSSIVLSDPPSPITQEAIITANPPSRPRSTAAIAQNLFECVLTQNKPALKQALKELPPGFDLLTCTHSSYTCLLYTALQTKFFPTIKVLLRFNPKFVLKIATFFQKKTYALKKHQQKKRYQPFIEMLVALIRLERKNDDTAITLLAKFELYARTSPFLIEYHNEAEARIKKMDEKKGIVNTSFEPAAPTIPLTFSYSPTLNSPLVFDTALTSDAGFFDDSLANNQFAEIAEFLTDANTNKLPLYSQDLYKILVKAQDMLNSDADPEPLYHIQTQLALRMLMPDPNHETLLQTVVQHDDAALLKLALTLLVATMTPRNTDSMLALFTMAVVNCSEEKIETVRQALADCLVCVIHSDSVHLKEGTSEWLPILEKINWLQCIKSSDFFAATPFSRAIVQTGIERMTAQYSGKKRPAETPQLFQAPSEEPPLTKKRRLNSP